nr:ECF transporter S component [Anaerocolumna sedimenticola]
MLSGIILGPVYGGLAAGIGSMFADLFSGYAGYAAATFIIKALAAVAGSIAFHVISSITPKLWLKMVSVVIAGILGGVVVTGGYFIFEAYIMGLGFATAITGVPFNLLQNVFGIIVSFLLFPVLYSIQSIKAFHIKTN